ncbi:MAG: hypothetical protein GF320_18875 [Armatimonadia bacterium]|nr:hypothetical protein [Armatimonadia bacterium]
MVRLLHAALPLALGVAAVLAGGCASGGDAADGGATDAELAHAYVAALGGLALDAAALEEASAEMGASTASNEAGQTDRTRLNDGGECYRNGEGEMVVEGPGRGMVVGTPEGPRQVRWGNGWVDGEYEPGQGQASRDRIRLRLRSGECIVEPPENPGQGPLSCRAPGGWAFTVEETDGESSAVTTYTVTVGTKVVLVAEREDGSLVVTQPDGSLWTVGVQDDGTILATSPAGHEWVLTITDDKLVATGGATGRTFELSPQ